MATIIHDTFTGSSGNLTGHSPDTGGAWNQHGSYASCTLNLDGAGACGVGSNNVDALYYNSTTPASADYDVTVKINVAGATQFPAAAGRINTGANTYYRAQAQPDAGTLYLYKTVGGSTTQLGSTATGISWATGDTITLSMAGTTIVAKRNGTALITVTDSAISATGNAGLKHYGTTSGAKFDEVTVVDSSATSATAFTLTGASAGPIGLASSNFSFTPTGGVYTGTLTPTMTGLSGSWSPSTLTWSGDASTKTSTFTPSATGSGNANATSSPSLTQPSNVAFTSKSVTQRTLLAVGAPTGLSTMQFTIRNSDGTAFSDWTGTGVVEDGGGAYHAPATLPSDYVGTVFWRTSSSAAAGAGEYLSELVLSPRGFVIGA